MKTWLRYLVICPLVVRSICRERSRSTGSWASAFPWTISAPATRRYAENRPILHPRHHPRPRHRSHCDRDHRHGPQPATESNRRRRRVHRPGDIPEAPQLRPDAKLPDQRRHARDRTRRDPRRRRCAGRGRSVSLKAELAAKIIFKTVGISPPASLLCLEIAVRPLLRNQQTQSVCERLRVRHVTGPFG
jgi:hypothetical protein